MKIKYVMNFILRRLYVKYVTKHTGWQTWFLPLCFECAVTVCNESELSWHFFPSHIDVSECFLL